MYLRVISEIKFSVTAWFGYAINLGFRTINKRDGQKVPIVKNKSKSHAFNFLFVCYWHNDFRSFCQFLRFVA